MIKIIIDYPFIDLLLGVGQHFGHCVCAFVCVGAGRSGRGGWQGVARSPSNHSVLLLLPPLSRCVVSVVVGNGDKSHHANSAMKVSTLCLSAPSLYLLHCFSGPSLIILPSVNSLEHIFGAEDILIQHCVILQSQHLLLKD